MLRVAHNQHKMCSVINVLIALSPIAMTGCMTALQMVAGAGGATSPQIEKQWAQHRAATKASAAKAVEALFPKEVGSWRRTYISCSDPSTSFFMVYEKPSLYKENEWIQIKNSFNIEYERITKRYPNVLNKQDVKSKNDNQNISQERKLFIESGDSLKYEFIASIKGSNISEESGWQIFAKKESRLVVLFRFHHSDLPHNLIQIKTDPISVEGFDFQKITKVRPHTYSFGPEMAFQGGPKECFSLQQAENGDAVSSMFIGLDRMNGFLLWPKSMRETKDQMGYINGNGNSIQIFSASNDQFEEFFKHYNSADQLNRLIKRFD